MARPKELTETVIVSLRLEVAMDQKLADLAALETINSGRHVSKLELIRDALSYVYSDNERLRECFRRSRSAILKKLRKNQLN